MYVLLWEGVSTVKELEPGIAYHLLKEIFLVMNYLSTTRSVM